MLSLALLFAAIQLVICDPPLTYATFRSPAVKLRSGQIANTRSDQYPLEFPKGPIAVRYFVSRVVDEKGNNVSVTDMYVHHYLIYNGFTNGGLCPNLPNIWGVGAEMQNVVYAYNYPTAVVLTGQEQWTVNLHFIRTTNVPDALVQDCIECRCKDSNPPLHPHGEVNCCIDGAQCWGMQNSTIMDAQNYYLEYTIGYVPVTPDVIPLSIFSLDSTATATSDCQIDYDVPGLAPGEFHIQQSDNIIPDDWNVTYVEIHQHIGGEGMYLEHFRQGVHLGQLCNSTPVYIESGEGKGHLVDIPPCLFNPQYQIRQGDVLRLISNYSARTVPGGNPWHAGVMGLIFVAASAKPDAKTTCLNTMHYYCGAPIYSSGANCLGCVTYPAVEEKLKEAGCTTDWVKAECAKNNDGGNIPSPDEVHDMSLHVTTTSPTSFHFNFSCPTGAWCAIAVNTAGQALMENATAFVYSKTGSAYGFQERTLGNHNSGVIINPAYPATITTTGSIVNFQFDAKNSLDPSARRVCFLFAQGAQGTDTFGYHGSTRGFMCMKVGSGEK
jgi:hypothetical protein